MGYIGMLPKNNTMVFDATGTDINDNYFKDITATKSNR